MTEVSNSSKLMVGVLLSHRIIQGDKEWSWGDTGGTVPMFSPLFFEQGSIISFERFQLSVSPALHIYVVSMPRE